MANGQGSHELEVVWTAIDGLRTQVQAVSERTAVLATQGRTQHSDVTELGQNLARAEQKLSADIASAEERINERFDRVRNWVIGLMAIAVPIVSAVLGALTQRGG